MLKLQKVHHIAIICSNIEQSVAFYCDVLGCTVLARAYRENRDSWKIDLGLNGAYIIELFSFPGAPPRPSRPEAQGLRHLAFAVKNVNEAAATLAQMGINAEAVRTDEFTGKEFLFFQDPDGLPLELYEE